MTRDNVFHSGYVYVCFMNGKRLLVRADSADDVAARVGPVLAKDIAKYEPATKREALDVVKQMMETLDLNDSEVKLADLLPEGASVEDLEAMKKIRAITGCGNEESVDMVNDRFKAMNELNALTGLGDAGSVDLARDAFQAPQGWDGVTERRKTEHTDPAPAPVAEAASGEGNAPTE